MKSREITAGRYAKALLQVAHEADAAEATLAELERFQEVFATQPDLQAVLQRPWLKPAERSGVATAVAERSGASPLVQRFLGLIAARGRADHLQEIVAAYRGQVDVVLGRARARVRTAAALTDDEKTRIAERLGRTLGKRVIVEEITDRSLLGGFVAQVGSLVVDGSLDGQLARLHRRLARG